MALDWQTVHIPFASGLDTESDPRALDAPSLTVCRNAEFDEIGGLQLRKPYAAISSTIVGGGTISDARRIVANGDELLLFTKSALYSWSDVGGGWVLKATHLAAKLTEASRFVSTAEQTCCDRAEVNNVILFAWEQATATTEVYMAALDKATGAVILAPTQVGSGYSQPRLLAMGDHFLVFMSNQTTNTLACANVRTSALATDLATFPESTIVATNYGTVTGDGFYDVARATATTAVVASTRTVAATHNVSLVTSAAGAATAPTVTTSTKSRRADGPIAVAVAPDSTHAQIVRLDESALPVSSVVGDYLQINVAFTSVTTGQALGTASGSVPQVGAAYRSVTTGGQYRCYAFWSDQHTDNFGPFSGTFAWVDTGGTITAGATFVNRLTVASRPFDHEGSVYVWLAFAGVSDSGGVAGLRAQLQNTYFLYRDDGLLVAKATATRGGGHATRGHLPNVQAIDDGERYAWCGTERRAIPVGTGNQTDYAARSPREIIFEFDSDEARRTARLGNTLYLTGGEVLQYDGQSLAEVGFHVYPYRFAVASSGTGSVANGTYSIKATWRSENAVGERDRSTTATVAEVTVTGGPHRIAITGVPPLMVTHKTAAAEFWRTLVNPTLDAPFYLVSSNDPSDVAGDNCYVPNVTTASSLTLSDAFSDATAATKEINPENGGILENLAPPAATIITATHERLFLAGIAGEPHRIWYSKRRSEGEVASFHDALTIDLPAYGGAITALAIMDDTLYAFRETSVYAIPGDGFDNAGGGQNYGPPRRLSSDTGALSGESVALTPVGLIYKSSKGWYMLTRGGDAVYIGGAVKAFDADEILSILVVESQHQVRCLSAARLLVFDYHAKVQQWSEWTVADGLDAAIWQGVYTYAATAAVKVEQSTYAATDYALDIETAWVKLGGLQGYQCIRWLQILGEYRSACCVRVRIARDYLESDASGVTWFDDKYWTVSPTVVGGPLQVQHGPSVTKCQAIKLRLTTYAAGSTTLAPSGEALRLTGLGIEVGLMRGLNRRLPAAQKQGGSG